MPMAQDARRRAIKDILNSAAAAARRQLAQPVRGSSLLEARPAEHHELQQTFSKRHKFSMQRQLVEAALFVAAATSPTHTPISESGRVTVDSTVWSHGGCTSRLHEASSPQDQKPKSSKALQLSRNISPLTNSMIKRAARRPARRKASSDSESQDC